MEYPVITSKRVSEFHNEQILLFRIENSSGSCIEVLNYGATLVSFIVPDSWGKLRNVILRYKDTKSYFADTCYLGSTIGRFANRVSQASFRLDDRLYRLDRNDGNNSNHGGFSGFSGKILDHRMEKSGVTFFGISKDGEGGYPGTVHFAIAYSFSQNDELLIEYKAESDKRTPFNLTSHAYFNLSEAKDILTHEVKIAADRYLETDSEFLPTGKILPVADTAYDFRNYRRIADMMSLKKEILKGYNTYFVCREHDSDNLRLLASLCEPGNGLKLDVYSTLPGVQFYTGDYLTGEHQPFRGLCLEAQHYPDFVNHSQFPSCIIGPGRQYHEKIKFSFQHLVP